MYKAETVSRSPEIPDHTFHQKLLVILFWSGLENAAELFTCKCELFDF